MKIDWNKNGLKVLKLGSKCLNIDFMYKSEHVLMVKKSIDQLKYLVHHQMCIPSLYTFSVNDYLDKYAHKFEPFLAEYIKEINNIPDILCFPDKKVCALFKTSETDSTGFLGFILIEDFKGIYMARFRYFSFLGNKTDEVEIEVVTNGFKNPPDNFIEHLTKYIENYILISITYGTFKKFVDVETVLLKGKKKNKVVINKEKYLSNDPLPIEIIDSKYFRNIIRTNGFKVQGHFRMQPYGPNRSKRRLIWINEFEKQGYSIKAKKNQH
jgi:hypothetical protein